MSSIFGFIDFVVFYPLYRHSTVINVSIVSVFASSFRTTSSLVCLCCNFIGFYRLSFYTFLLLPPFSFFGFFLFFSVLVSLFLSEPFSSLLIFYHCFLVHFNLFEGCIAFVDPIIFEYEITSVQRAPIIIEIL